MGRKRLIFRGERASRDENRCANGKTDRSKSRQQSHAVDIDPTGRYIASTGRDFTLKVYETESARMCHSVALGRRSPKGLCFFDVRTVIVSNYWGELIKVTLDDGKVARRTIAANGISSVSRSGDNVVATSYDGAIYLVRVDDLAVVQTLREMTQRASVGHAS